MNINLMPQESVVTRFSFSLYTIGLSVLALAAVAFSALGIEQHTQLTRQKALVKSLSEQLGQESMVAAQLRSKLQAAGVDVTNPRAAVHVATLLSQISDTGRGKVRLTDFQWNGTSVSMSGSARSLRDIGDAAGGIGHLPFVSSVAIEGIVGSGGSELSFSLAVTFDGKDSV